MIILSIFKIYTAIFLYNKTIIIIIINRFEG